VIRSRRNVGKHKMNCYYGCCPAAPRKMQTRLIKRKEQREWKKEVRNVAG
jgi:hypothetical protein